MKIKLIGQAGVILREGKTTVLIDPYLSNNVALYEPQNQRRQIIDEKVFGIKPDYILITHSHLDHFDKKTLDIFFEKNNGLVVISPKSVYKEITKYGGNNKYVELNAGEDYCDADISVKAVKAFHSDEYAVGFVVCLGAKSIYITGDTLYNEKLADGLPERLDAIILPINGYGNNMNAEDATILADAVNAEIAVPVHYGMFDDISPYNLKSKNRKIIGIYKETEI